MRDLENRVVLITGSSGGLGGPVTRAFLEAGALVVGVDRTAAGPGHERFTGVAADLLSPEGARLAVERAIQRHGRLDALVHLLGGFAGGAPVSQTEDHTWRQMLDLNLNAAFHVFRAALPHLQAAGQGRLIAIGSRTGLEPAPNLAAYNVSKAGLIALVRTIAAELRGARATANVVLPSVIDTPANRAANPAADYDQWVRPESIAGLLVWLASEASADVNGAVLPIYGRA